MKKGDIVEFYDPRGGWRVGTFIRTIERGKKFGMVQVQITIPAYERKVYVRPDEVKALKGGE